MPEVGDDYVAELQTRMAILHEHARMQLGKAATRQKRNCDERPAAHPIPIGSSVFYFLPVVGGKGRSAKLRSFRTGLVWRAR